MNRLLITRSRHDPTTNYLYEYCEEVISQAQNKGWKVEEANTGVAVQSRLAKNNPDLVLFNGHGNEDCILGNNNDVLVNTENAELLAGKTVFARACSSLRKLGKQAVSKGCNAYVGYADNFVFFTINEMEATPLKDPAAKPALEVSNTVALKLVEGNSVVSAVAAARKKSVEWMTKMLASKEPYARQTFDSLLLNHLRLGIEPKA